MRRSIEAQHTSVAYANRAMAHLKTGNAQAADEDCSAALALDPNYLKAWHRRCSARRALGRHLDAIDDLEQALRLLYTLTVLHLHSAPGHCNGLTGSHVHTRESRQKICDSAVQSMQDL
jgi:tetratricopeptide (TPR) repeat protein